MRAILNFVLIFSLFIISACSSSYKELNNNSYNPPTKFTKYLMDHYKVKADFEAQKMHDWDSAKLYSEKALLAANGVNIKPEKINYWKIDNENKYKLEKAYSNLMEIYNDAIKIDPYNLAVSISSLDCWAEQQEENWQTWDINDCKENFLNSIHQIYNKLAENEKKINNINNKSEDNNDSVTVVTKDSKEKILQIIYFDFDKSDLSSVSINKIKKFIEKNFERINKYLVVGHADTKGTNKYNDALSLKRALIVKDILVKLGIDNKNIKVIAKGENELRIKTSDEVAHPANRRAEIRPLN